LSTVSLLFPSTATSSLLTIPIPPTAFFLTAHFSEDDFPYDWLMLWLSRRPEWQRSREVETTTRSGGPGGSSSSSRGSSSGSSSPWGTPTGGSNTGGGATHPSAHSAHYNEEDRDWDMWEAALYAETNSAASAAHWGESGNDNSEDGVRPRTRVVFQPTYDTTHTIFYRGHWLRVRRGRKDNGSEMLSISVVARNNAILKQLVLQAKKEYEAEAVHRIQIYFADAHGSWRWTDSRHKRPLNSIVLNPGVKEMLVDDARDFLRSEKVRAPICFDRPSFLPSFRFLWLSHATT
jgi:chaperone BCS1